MWPLWGIFTLSSIHSRRFKSFSSTSWMIRIEWNIFISTIERNRAISTKIKHMESGNSTKEIIHTVLLSLAGGIGRASDEEDGKFQEGKDCLNSLKDLKKILKQDFYSSQRNVFFLLSEWNFTDKSLIPAFLHYSESVEISKLVRMSPTTPNHHTAYILIYFFYSGDIGSFDMGFGWRQFGQNEMGFIQASAKGYQESLSKIRLLEKNCLYDGVLFTIWWWR